MSFTYEGKWQKAIRAARCTASVTRANCQFLFDAAKTHWPLLSIPSSRLSLRFKAYATLFTFLYAILFILPSVEWKPLKESK